MKNYQVIITICALAVYAVTYMRHPGYDTIQTYLKIEQ